MNSTMSAYTDAQKAMLSKAGVDRPQDLSTPELKLEFANSGQVNRRTQPADAYRLSLDHNKMQAGGIEPTTRIDLQHKMDLLAQGRFERSTGVSERSVSDEKYLSALREVLPFADEEAATIIPRILQYYGHQA